MSKIDCGTLTRTDKDGVEFQGSIQIGRRLDGILILRKHARAGISDDHPDFAVEYSPQNGRARPIGAAWIKNGKQVGDFISLALDDPDWPSPLNLSAFPKSTNPDESAWVIVWTRPRGLRIVQEQVPGPNVPCREVKPQLHQPQES